MKKKMIMTVKKGNNENDNENDNEEMNNNVMK